MSDDELRAPQKHGKHGPLPAPWRVGRHVERTIYDADNQLIGVMDTPEDAALIVRLVNQEWARP